MSGTLLLRTLYELIGGVLSLVLPIVTRKEENLIVLTSFHGKGYRGNTRSLYEALTENDAFRVVWLSRDPEIVSYLKKEFGSNRAERMHSLRGLRTLASASVLFFTHGTSDFSFLFLPRRSLRIQTYHGLPTKRGEYLRPHSGKKPGLLHRMVLYYRFSPISYFLSSSPLVSSLFSQRFGLPSEKFIETGYPSYDSLINTKNVTLLPNQFWPSAPKAVGIILYAPTFRRRIQTRWFPFDEFDVQELLSLLNEKNLLLALRQHPNDSQNLSRFLELDERIVKADHTIAEDVTELLGMAKVIVSDYSSITIEGLLYDIPSVYLPYDLPSYERGLILPYDQMTAGPVSKTGSEFTTALRDALERPDLWREKREELRNKFLLKEKGRSTENVIQFLLEHLR